MQQGLRGKKERTHTADDDEQRTAGRRHDEQQVRARKSRRRQLSHLSKLICKQIVISSSRMANTPRRIVCGRPSVNFRQATELACYLEEGRRLFGRFY